MSLLRPSSPTSPLPLSPSSSVISCPVLARRCDSDARLHHHSEPCCTTRLSLLAVLLRGALGKCRHGAVSRPDLQRRFPDLAPATLKEVLSNIAQLDTIGRR